MSYAEACEVICAEWRKEQDEAPDREAASTSGFTFEEFSEHSAVDEACGATAALSSAMNCTLCRLHCAMRSTMLSRDRERSDFLGQLIGSRHRRNSF